MPSDKKFGSLLGATMEAVVKGAQIGKAQLDLALAKRDRMRALAELGEKVAEAVGAGRMKIAGEMADALRRVKEVEEKIAQHEKRAEGTVSSRDAADDEDDDLH